MMPILPRVKPIVVLFLLLLSLIASGCSPAATNPSPLPAVTSASTPEATQTPPEPTSTPLPLAVRINDGGVLLADYAAELARYQAAQQGLGRQVSAEAAREAVLEELINQQLLVQAAQAAGREASDADLQARVDQLAAQMGGQPALDQWLSANGYTLDSFKSALRPAVLAAWQRDAIIEAVPQKAEQVHARQILVQNAAEAEQIAAQIQAGADFATLAYNYDAATGGELGWLPRGVLLQPEVEQAVFSLQPGQVTGVIQSQIGYHIVWVSERDPERLLDATNRQILQEKALRDWLEQRRAESQVEILVP